MQELDLYRGGVPGAPRASTDTRAASLLGIGAIACALGGFLLWASLAPLNGAVVSTGNFIAQSRNKIIQHLEGGIIKEILVREGDIVERGQPLLTLDETAARALSRRLALKRHLHRAMRARLAAEARGASALQFPASLKLPARDSEFIRILEGQRTEFLARKQKLENETAVIVQRKQTLSHEISGLKAQKQATITQLGLLKRELRGIEKLYRQGFTTLTRLLALKRAHAQLQGSFGEFDAKIARTQEQMRENDREIAHLNSKARENVLEQLRQTDAALHEIDSQITASKDVVTRLEITAPVRGIVVKLAQNTRGGVIASGQKILELLPVDDELVIETRIKPADIDVVSRGQHARVRLTALNQRQNAAVDGKVAYVSADLVQGDANTQPHYLARIKLARNATAKFKTFKPVPGMPVEVFITTGARSFLSYLIAPIRDSFARALREV